MRESLNRVLLRHLVQDTAQQTANSIRLARLLEAHDCGGLKTLFHAGGRDGAARVGPRPVAGAPLRRQVPRHRRADSPHRRRGSRRLTAATGRPDESGFRAPRGAAQRRGLRGCLRGLDDYGKLRHLLTVNRQLNGNFDLLRHLIGTGWVDSEITSGFPLEHLNQRENFLSLLHYLLSIRELREGTPRLGIPNQTVRRLMCGYLRDGYRDVGLFAVDLYAFSRLVHEMACLGAWRPLLEFLAAAIRRQTGIRDYMAGEKVIQGFLAVPL